MTESILEIRLGTLVDDSLLFIEGTRLISAEIQLARLLERTRGWIQSQRTLVKLRAFYTNNFGLYALENQDAPGVHNETGEAYLYFGGRENNPIFGNLEEACRQLTLTGNYVPSTDNAVTAKGSALRVRLADLNLQEHNDELSYYEIDTSNYNLLNPAQRALAEAVHGSGEQFGNVMKMLREAGISKTRIYVLNPKYVQKHAKEHDICRACWLDNFNGGSFFGAYVRSAYTAQQRPQYQISLRSA
jgi:hypothetical protein